MMFIIKCFLVIYLVIWDSKASNDYNKFNLVQVNLSDSVYKRLMINKENVLSATPLAILDVSLLTKYHCYKNIRRSLWSLGLPIIFWNNTYMDRIRKSIKESSQLQSLNIDNVTILPPSGIIAYRVNWRRTFGESMEGATDILLDTQWNDAQTDYVLPMRHTFLLEFREGNNSKTICSEIRETLINESFQSSEFTVEFQKEIRKNQTIPRIHIKINDLREVSLYEDSGCQSKSEDKCHVSINFAEKWALETSSQIMKNVDMVHLSLQKDIYDVIFRYLCMTKVALESVTVKRLRVPKENEMACQIPNDVYITTKKVCDNYNYNYHYGRNGYRCRNETNDLGNSTIIRINPFYSYNERSQFSIPIQGL